MSRGGGARATGDGECVWVRDAGGAGFILARLGELLADGRAEIIPVNSKLPVRSAHMDDVFPAVPAPHSQRDLDDNCELMYLNEATLLNNVVTRYHKDKIYTYVANILVAVNPYKEIPGLYAAETVRRYQGRSLGELPPHVFAIADKAFRDMLTLKQSQSIIVSGESGAGKTESTKYILRYLCHTQHAAGPVEQKILDANPILESFGNARTVRNNNSSRFGKFMAVHFSAKGEVRGGHIAHYLLEQSRLVSQAPRERNYHVFYLLCAGAPPALRAKLHLTQPDHYTYLKGGCTQYFTSAASDKKLSPEQLSAAQRKEGALRDPLLDDVEDFQRLHQALGVVGLSESEREGVYSVVAAALHLGNVSFEEEGGARGGCVVSPHAEQSLQRAAQLLGVDPAELRHALVARLMQSARGGHKGTAIMVPLKMHEAMSARDALAKAVYSRLFDYIVRRINDSIPFQAAAYYIGILDIAGFEYFEQNSFEQFCINYCNEKLQQFFNERILKHEQELYRREGLRVPEIAFVDNQDCIELLESRSHGVFHLLDEESKLPRPDPASFTRHVHSQLAPNSDRIQMPRASRLKAHRSLRDDEGFLLRHFAGAVCYNTRQFIEKNNDALHASLEYLVAESNSTLVQQLFRTSGNNDDISQAKGKLGFVSVGAKFQNQLAQLMDRLKENGTNFVRCMKPNSHMVSGELEGGLVLTQLQCSGTIAVLRLMEHGYPSRAPFHDLHTMYKQYLPAKLHHLSPKLFCEAMVHALGLGSGDFVFGLTRVFFRPGKYSAFDTMLRADPENLRAVVARVLKWLVKARWRRAVFAVLSCVKLKNKILYRRACLVVLQSAVRGFLARRRHRPRLAASRKLRALSDSAQQLDAVAERLAAPQRDAAMQRVRNLRNDVTSARATVKNNDKLSKAELEQLCNKLATEVDSQMAALQKAMVDQKNREEQERLRKLETELRAAEEAKQREAERLRQEEEHRKLRVEMEARRQQEEAALRLEERDRLAALKLQEQLDEAARKDHERVEQERRDLELAVRLASETNGNVEGSPPAPRSDSMNGVNVLNRTRAPATGGGGGGYDLSKWKYSELRDTINTSCDIHLLEACRHEFHRRLKVYHAWKAKNARKHQAEPERAPLSIMEAARMTRAPGTGDVLGSRHRYFRIPFVRPGGGDGNRGWWYAHFDGQYVARQMELHPDKTPVLLQAGVDDMQMCELSLEETGLTRKRGAEILQHEFEREWTRHGGATYTPR